MVKKTICENGILRGKKLMLTDLVFLFTTD